MSNTRAECTAIRRTGLSRPVALALDDGLIHQERTFFDYGCGRGDDLLRLHKMGIPVSGWHAGATSHSANNRWISLSRTARSTSPTCVAASRPWRSMSQVVGRTVIGPNGASRSAVSASATR